MIKVTSYINEEDKLIGFRCSGHANYATKGQDIVCSAVSVLVINTINSIYEFTSDIITYDEDEEEGMIDFIITSNISSESELLLKSLFLGLQGIRDSYGTNYIKFNSKKIR
ncbi:MAG: ribosomal-processing cysteine protease Prp [Clostridiales bacterium]|nr:ribosomal-processing cysteine protease Prp [Clostridiales bacterium]